jgi:hypothetical protein
MTTTAITTRTIADPLHGNGLLDQERQLLAEYRLAYAIAEMPTATIHTLCAACKDAIDDEEHTNWLREDAKEAWQGGARYGSNRSRRAFFAVYILTEVQNWTPELAKMIISLRLSQWVTVARR